MASVLHPDAILDSYAHSCTESQLQQFLERENLTDTKRERLRTHGHVAVARVLEFNKESVGVVRVLLEQPEVQVNLAVDGATLLHAAVTSMGDREEDDDDEKRALSQQDHVQELADHLNEVSLILKRQDLDPNVQNRTGDTPLHEAARASSIKALDILLSDPRVNVAAVNYYQQTALHVACVAASPGTSDRLVRKIIDAARSNVRRFSGFLNKQDQFGNTALHYATARGLGNTVETILQETGSLRGRRGCNHELAVTQNNEGHLAIHFAAMNGHLGIVDRLLQFDSHVDVVHNVKDEKNFALLHHAVRSGREDILELCLGSISMSFDLILELLAVADQKDMADCLLNRVEVLSESWNDKQLRKGAENRYALVHWGVLQSNETFVALLVKWHPELAMVAMDEAVAKRNERIRLTLREHECVKREYKQMRKAYETYVTAANAILVVAVLIASLTYTSCMTEVDTAKLRRDIKELVAYGIPQGLQKFRIMDVIVLARLAFFQAMAATFLASLASLPFSFAFFFHEAVDDTKVKRLLHKTRVLIVAASYFLMMSLGALVFRFICSQLIAPHVSYSMTSACDKAVACFLLGATLFLGYNFLHYMNTRSEVEARRRLLGSSDKLGTLASKI